MGQVNSTGSGDLADLRKSPQNPRSQNPRSAKRILTKATKSEAHGMNFQIPPPSENFHIKEC